MRLEYIAVELISIAAVEDLLSTATNAYRRKRALLPGMCAQRKYFCSRIMGG